MRRLLFAVLVLALATAVHVDWHLARPTHHRLSLGWSYHWLFATAFFAAVGWIIARRWSTGAGHAAAWIVALALLIAQGVEPLLEVALYQHRIGYPSEPERWRAFALCVAAGLPALLLTLRLCRPRGSRDIVVPAA